MIKNIFLILVLMSLEKYSEAQASPDNNALTLPSINNKFFVSNSDINVNLYTGSPQINIPLFSLPSKELSIPVSLSYVNVRGNKLQDNANFVGLGWKLNAGGAVTRVVRGLPDDVTGGYIGINPSGSTVTTAAQATASSTVLTQIGSGQIDGEPDLYNVTTPYFSFQFVFDINGVPIFPNNSGYKITHNLKNNLNYLNTSFIITDDQGNQFFFGTTTNSEEFTTALLFNKSTMFTSTWYLDKIVSFNGRDQINLTYTTGTDYSVNHSFSTTASTVVSDVHFFPLVVVSSGNPPVTTVITTTYNSPKYISAITSSQGEIDFTYAFDRRDITYFGRLTSVSLYTNNQLTNTKGSLLRSFNLNYSYFGDPTSVQDLLRLRLDNLTEYGNGTFATVPLVAKTFSYNLVNNLPGKSDFTKSDVYGYYTTNPPNWTTAGETANILTGITDMTGETQQFTFERNDRYLASTNQQSIGLRIQKISKTGPDGTNIYDSYVYQDSLGHSSAQVYSIGANNASSLVRFNGPPVYAACPTYANQPDGSTCIFEGQITLSESLSDSYDLNGVLIGYSTVKIVNQNGGYEVNNFTNFSDYPDLLQSVPAQAYYYQAAPTSIAYKRGLLKYKGVFTASNTKIQEQYFAYSSLNNPITKTSYAITTEPVNFGTNIDYSNYFIYGTQQENFRLTNQTVIDYDQLNPANTLQNSYVLTYSPKNKRLIFKQSSTSSRGQVFSQTIYHADDTLIPMTTAAELTAIANILSANRTNVVVHAIKNNNGTTQQTHNVLTSYPYGFLNRTYVTAINSYNVNTLVKSNLFQYDVSNSNLVSSHANGAIPASTMLGYNGTQVIAKATNATNLTSYTNQPSATTGNLLFPAHGSGTLFTSFTTYALGTITIAFPPGSYLAGSVTCFFQFSLTGPATGSGSLCNSSVVGYTCSAPNTMSFPNMPAGTYTLSVSALTNTANSQLTFTYNYTSVISQPSSVSEFFFEGFEQNSSATFTGTPHTGIAYWNGNYTTPFAIPNSRNYLIQYWTFSGSTWTFHEAPYTGTMTITGPLDDIRIFPTDAMLTSYTYQPLVGVSSETSPDGKTVNYEYDGMNRLTLIRDHDKNIIKEFDYQYQTLSTPVGNNVKTGVFVTSNCAAGYSGGSVLYTVPAGTYFSFINQVDADQKAQNDVNANGQAFANSVGHQVCNAIVFHNAPQSGTFTRNNCAAGFAGGSYTYNVAAGIYSSTISQPDADQQAINDVNANGQNVANQNAACNAVCSFNWAANITNHLTTTVSSSGSTVNFVLVFVAPTNGFTNGTIGTITGGCIPSVFRSVTVTDGTNSSRLWTVSISTNGTVSISLSSGTAPTNSYPPVSLTGSFAK